MIDTPPIDQIVDHIIMVRGSSAWLAPEVQHDESGRPYWMMWNAISGNLEVWVAREAVTIQHINEVSELAQRLTKEMNAQPVSTVTGVDVPTFGELNDLHYIGVIVTGGMPSPEVIEYSEASSDVYTIILSDHQIRNAALEITLLQELEATKREEEG